MERGPARAGRAAAATERAPCARQRGAVPGAQRPRVHRGEGEQVAMPPLCQVSQQLCFSNPIYFKEKKE